jgi:hypothetical protein
VRYKRSVTKRSFKNFTKETWNEALDQEDWYDVEDCDDVNEMVEVFAANINRALDKVAPIKDFTIRSNHRFGLSDSTKKLMKQRDKTRSMIQRASGNEKHTLMQQYKTLRNKVTGKIRKENIDFNNNRIEEANNERELWNVAKEVINPRKENNWNIITEDGGNIITEKEVA